MASPLSTRRQALLAALPDLFGMPDVRAVAPGLGYVPRSAEAAVRDLARRGVVTCIRRGRFTQAACPPRASIPRAVAPRAVSTDVDLASPLLLLNRELSWIDFNWRVLAQALDPSIPLAERVRFAAITARNLDEFVRTRVGGLRQQVAAGVTRLSPDGRTPAEQDRLVRDALAPMWAALHGAWTETLQPLLAEAGLRVVPVESVSESARAVLDAHFERALFPLLTPLAVDRGRRFPFISNQSLSLAVVLRRPGRGPARETDHFARLKVPLTRGRFLPVADDPGAVVAVESLIRANVGGLFAGMEVRGAWAFRVTRSAAIERAGGEADDLVAMISEELRERQFADAVRLEADAHMPERVRTLLTRELDLDPADVWPVEGLVDLSGLGELATRMTRDAPDPAVVAFAPWTAAVPPALRGTADGSVFDAIRAGDVLVHHPFESFGASVQRFVESAADDPAVLAVKLTLYRTSDDSPIVHALVRAAEKGKQVAVLVEVQARFDEANNIEWARVLEDAGAHVAFGLPGLKTHAKTALVVRDEPDGLRTYVHFGTGNYNPSTARLYTDLGLFTADAEIGRDAAQLFHALTGSASRTRYARLLVAPEAMRRRFLKRIAAEAERAQSGEVGRIVAKMNAIEDPAIIAALYAASQAGVEIDLVVRGHCRLRPGLPGISDRIRVRSIVGRFLEHDRIFWFGNGGDPRVFIGSADWQRRNLDDRVEAIVPVRDAALRDRLRAILWSALRDTVRAWTLGADGRYVRAAPGRYAHDHQVTMMAWAERGGPPAHARKARL
ncbi:MAG TPA: polyphosphate kinase 1 [Rubricoccaceae bacterium]